VCGSGFGVQGFQEFRVPGAGFDGFRVFNSSGFRAQGLGFGVQGFQEFRVPGSGFRVPGFGFRVPVFGIRFSVSGFGFLFDVLHERD